MNATAAEIHAYPLRPRGFSEPLFHTAQSRREVAEHLLGALWLSRASELEGRGGLTAHAREEPIELRRRGGCVEVMRSRPEPGGPGRCSWRRRRIVGVIDRWREVGSWWNENDAVDTWGFRVALARPTIRCESTNASQCSRMAEAIVDLVRDHDGGWRLIGVVD